MAKNYDVLANSVVELIGGKDNVRFFTHCVTRLRFNVKDRSIVKMDEIKDLPALPEHSGPANSCRSSLGRTSARCTS